MTQREADDAGKLPERMRREVELSPALPVMSKHVSSAERAEPSAVMEWAR